jgi:hypothetical protein
MFLERGVHSSVNQSRLFHCVLGLLLLTGGAYGDSANFIPNWCLSNVGFDDGGAASGCFDYDPNTQTISNVFIVTTDGITSLRKGATYRVVSTLNIGVTNAFAVILFTTTAADQTGLPGLLLTFRPPLDVAVGVASIVGSLEATCEDATCANADTSVRSAVFGSGVVLSLSFNPLFFFFFS